MKILGLLLLLFGVGTLAIHFLEQPVEALAWIGNWGEGVAWGIRIGTTVLGLILLMGGKKDGKKKK
jgi:hypothetical protein